MIWRMRSAYWITHPTHTHREYLILIIFDDNNAYAKADHCCVYMYIACLIPIIFRSFTKMSSVQFHSFSQVKSSFSHSSLQFLSPFSFSYIPARVVIRSISMTLNSIVLYFRHLYGTGVWTQCPTRNLEAQDVSLCLEIHSWPVRVVKSCQYLWYRLLTLHIIDSHSLPPPHTSKRWHHRGRGGGRLNIPRDESQMMISFKGIPGEAFTYSARCFINISIENWY